MSDLITPSHVPWDHAYTLWEKGRALHSQGKFIEAGEAYCEAVTAYGYDPRSKAYALNNLGIIMAGLGHESKAAGCFTHALQLCPENAQILNNFGNARLALGDYTGANEYFLKSIARDPKQPDARLNAAVIKLLTGDLPRGWREYEWRWKSPTFSTRPLKTQKPRFSQKAAKNAKRILLWHEQGFGDSIQFIRYARMVKAATQGHILFLGPPELEKLFAHVEGVDEYRTTLPDVGEYDCHAPLLSLPDVFDTRLGNIPAEVPYVKVGKGESEKGGALRVGIVWAGRPEHGKDKWRSTKLGQWREVLSVPGVEWHSFQIGKRREELWEACELCSGVRDRATEIADYVDTARLLQGMDLLISVDTSVVHLAGALGVETWMLTPFNPDWRWLLGTDRSEWYPNTLRLFRQERLEDWAPVFERVKEALLQKVAKETKEYANS